MCVCYFTYIPGIEGFVGIELIDVPTYLVLAEEVYVYVCLCACVFMCECACMYVRVCDFTLLGIERSVYTDLADVPTPVLAKYFCYCVLGSVFPSNFASIR